MRSWLDFQETSLGESEVSLGAVFNEICELIAEHEPKWTREWKRALDRALEDLLAGPLDKETLEGWHNQQKATLFLRVEMEIGRLQIYVRDRITEEVLRLRPQDWVPFSPKHDVVLALPSRVIKMIELCFHHGLLEGSWRFPKETS